MHPRHYFPTHYFASHYFAPVGRSVAYIRLVAGGRLVDTDTFTTVLTGSSAFPPPQKTSVAYSQQGQSIFSRPISPNSSRTKTGGSLNGV